MVLDSFSFLDQSLHLFADSICCAGPNNYPSTKATSQSSDNSKTTSRTRTRSRTGAPSSSTLQMSDNFNPFGSTTVGEIKSVVECVNEKFTGELYITTRAIIFRRMGLFGLEADRIILPFEIVTSVTKHHHHNDAVIVTTTNKTDPYLFSRVKDLDHVLGVIRTTRKEAEASPSPLEKTAVNRMFRTITTLTSDNDSISDLENTVSHSPNEADTGDTLDLFSMLKDVNPIQTNKLWNKLNETIHEKGNDAQKVAVDVPVDCTVHQFYKIFLADNVTNSVGTYHQQNGDYDVIEAKWENNKDGDIQRRINYKHPISIPMGPQFGAAEKTQTLKKFGNYGLCIITKTWVNDVPMADCFYVEDYLLVRSNPEGGVLVSLRFDVCFVKRTMFKKIITMTSVSDLTKFHTAFLQYIQDRVKGAVVDTNDNALEKISDLILHEDDSISTSITSEEETLLRKETDLFQTIISTCSQTFGVLMKNVMEINPLVWVIFITLLINQIHVASQLRDAQGKIATLESLLEKSEAIGQLGSSFECSQ